MFSMQRCFKTNQRLARGTSNLVVERKWSIVIFKIDVFFVLLKEEIPNKSVSEILGSSMLRMLLKKMDFSSEKIEQWRR